MGWEDRANCGGDGNAGGGAAAYSVAAKKNARQRLSNSSLDSRESGRRSRRWARGDVAVPSTAVCSGGSTGCHGITALETGRQRIDDSALYGRKVDDRGCCWARSDVTIPYDIECGGGGTAGDAIAAQGIARRRTLDSAHHPLVLACSRGIERWSVGHDLIAVVCCGGSAVSHVHITGSRGHLRSSWTDHTCGILAPAGACG